MKYKSKLVFAMIVSTMMVLLSISSLAFANPQMTFRDESKFRVIDTTGAMVGAELMQRAIPGVGIGNIIFSTSPLPRAKEDQYKGIGKDFRLNEIKDFYARAYFPGRFKDMINYVESTNTGYKFVYAVEEMMTFIYPGGADKTIKMTIDKDTQEWDSVRFDLLPQSDFDIPLDRAAKGKGESTVQLYVYLKFQTGTKLVKIGGVTKEVPTYREYLIAYGECKVRD